MTTESGRQYILKTLTESSDPWKAILEVQNNLSLGGIEGGRWNPCLAFLDEIGCSRNVIYFHLLEKMKNRLMKFFENKSEEQLSEILKACIPLITIPELRSIPLYIIKKLPIVPKKYLSSLAKHNYLGELPLHVQRYAWEISDSAFHKELTKPCEVLVQHYSSSSSNISLTGALSSSTNIRGGTREDVVASLTRLKEIIGQSEILFFKFCVYCHDQSTTPNIINSKLMMTANSCSSNDNNGQYDKMDICSNNDIDVLSRSNNSSSWGRLVIEMVVKLQEYQSSSSGMSGSSAQGMMTQPLQSYQRRFGKTVEFALLLDTIRRQQQQHQQSSLSHQQSQTATQIANRPYGSSVSTYNSAGNTNSTSSSIDEGKLYQIFRYLKSFIFAQASELEKRSAGFAEKLKKVNLAATVMADNSNTTSINSIFKSVVVTKSKTSQQQHQQHQSGSSQPPKPSSKAKLADSERAQAECIKSALQKAVDDVTKLDLNRVFAEKVTEDMAPGYSLAIPHPMDLSIIKKKLNRPTAPAASHAYLSLEALDADMCLMFDNCILFNGSQDYYGKLATELKDKWEHQIKPNAQNRVKKLLQQHPPNSDTPSSILSLQPSEPSVAHYKPSSSSSSSGSVKQKRQRTPVRKKKARYRDDDSDVEEEDNEEELSNENDDDDDEEDDDKFDFKQTKRKSKRMRMNHDDDDDDEDSESNGDDNHDYKSFKKKSYHNTYSSTSKFKITKPSPVTTATTDLSGVSVVSLQADRQVLLEGLLRSGWNVVALLDVYEVFKSPVSDKVAKDYSKEILHPMDFGTLIQRLSAHVYKDLKSFDADMCLIFDNCVQYNYANSDLGRLAKKLKRAWEKERKIIENNRELKNLDSAIAAAAVAARSVNHDNKKNGATAHISSTAATVDKELTTTGSNSKDSDAKLLEIPSNITSTANVEVIDSKPESVKPLIKRSIQSKHNGYSSNNDDNSSIRNNSGSSISNSNDISGSSRNDSSSNRNDSGSNSNSNVISSSNSNDISSYSSSSSRVVDDKAADVKPVVMADSHVTLFPTATIEPQMQPSSEVVKLADAMATLPFPSLTDTTSAAGAEAVPIAIPTVTKPKTYSKEEMAVILSECLQHLIDSDTRGLFAFPSDAKSQDDEAKMDLATMRIKVERGKYRRQQLQSAAAAAVLSSSSSQPQQSAPVTAVDVMDKDVQNMVQCVLSLCTDLSTRHYCTKYLREWKRHLVQKGLKAYAPSPGDDVDDEDGNNGNIKQESEGQKLNTEEQSLIATAPVVSSSSSHDNSEIRTFENTTNDSNTNSNNLEDEIALDSSSSSSITVKADDVPTAIDTAVKGSDNIINGSSSSSSSSYMVATGGGGNEENGPNIVSTAAATAAAVVPSDGTVDHVPVRSATTSSTVSVTPAAAVTSDDGVIEAKDVSFHQSMDNPEEEINTSYQSMDNPDEKNTSYQSVDSPEEEKNTSYQSMDNPEHAKNTSYQSMDNPEDEKDTNNQSMDYPEDDEAETQSVGIDSFAYDQPPYSQESRASSAFNSSQENTAVLNSNLTHTISSTTETDTTANAAVDVTSHGQQVGEVQTATPPPAVMKLLEDTNVTPAAASTAAVTIDSAVVLKFKRPKAATANTTSSSSSLSAISSSSSAADDGGPDDSTAALSSSSSTSSSRSTVPIAAKELTTQATVASTTSASTAVIWKDLVMSSTLEAIEVLRRPMVTTAAAGGGGNGAMVELPGLFALTGTHYITATSSHTGTTTTTAVGSAANGGSAVTAVGTGNQLSWALLMMRSEGLQSAILSYLGTRLKTTANALNVSQPTASTSITGLLSRLNTAAQHSTSITHKSLPYHDRGVRMALQLLQLSFPSSFLLQSLSQTSSSKSSSSSSSHQSIVADMMFKKSNNCNNSILFPLNETILREVLPTLIMEVTLYQQQQQQQQQLPQIVTTEEAVATLTTSVMKTLKDMGTSFDLPATTESDTAATTTDVFMSHVVSTLVRVSLL